MGGTMKRIFTIFTFSLIILSLSAMPSISFSPREIQLNRLSTLSFDPVSPQSQPILATVNLTNGSTQQRLRMQVVLKWNNNTIIQPGEVLFISRDAMAPGQSVTLTNRDMITEQGNIEFEADGNIDIDIMNAVESFPTLEEAALSGYFPDGVLQLEVSVKGENAPNWEATDIFRIRIRNAGAIHLISPGRLVGQNPPKVSGLPISFFWNAVNTGFNEERIVIREYPPHTPPQAGNIERSGSEVYHSQTGVSSGFSEYIPFNNGYYYAWQIYVPLYDENNPNTLRAAASSNLKSRWYVFQYDEDFVGDDDASDVQALLNLLADVNLLNLQNLGYTPTGEVIYNGVSYKGQEAIDLLSKLIGKELDIKIRD